MSEDWLDYRLGEILTRRIEQPPIEHSQQYKRLTVAINGRGLRLRDVVTGANLGTAKYIARKDDLVVSKIDARKGAAGVLPEHLDGVIVTSDFVPFIVDQGKALPDFLDLWVRQPSFAALCDGISGGTTNRVRMDLSRFPEIPISLPPLPVQRRIVDLMAHLDNHLANLQTERDAAEGLLAHLRGRLMESSEQVPLSKLAEPTGIQIGPFGSQLHAREYSETGVPVVMPKNLINGRIEEAGIKRVPPEVAERLSRHLLRPGDIVFPRRGDLTKRALVTESQDGWLCGTGCIRFRPATDVDGSLVFETLSGAEVTDWLVEHAVGTTMLNLNTEIVSKLPIADPSTGSKELSEASRLQAEVCEALRQERADVLELRNAVLSRVINGSMAIPEVYDSLLPEVA